MKLLKELINEAIDIYSDYDMPINACLETYFINECKMNDDDSFELSLILSDFYTNKMM